MKRFFTVLSLLFIVGTALYVSDDYAKKPLSAQSEPSAVILPTPIRNNINITDGFEQASLYQQNEFFNY